MASGPTKPIESYPDVRPEERPALPPVDPAGAPTTAAAADAVPLPAERLAFRPRAGKAAEETVPLDYPFERDGVVIDSITVRRLTVAEVAEVADAGDAKALGMWAFYAVQTGLPVGVLRGLDEDDGDRVVEVARRFLPRAFRAMLNRSDGEETSSSPSPEPGAATSPA